MVSPEVDGFVTVHFPNEIHQLLEMAQNGKWGEVAIAECDDLSLRARLFDYFRRRLETEGIYVYNFEIRAKYTNLARSLTELTDSSRFKDLDEKYQAIVIFVSGLEKFDDEQRSNFIRLLSYSKDRFLTIAHPIVIWGTTSFVTHLSHEAPDFWQWKEHFFDFSSVSDQLPPLKVDIPSHLSPIQGYLYRVARDPDYAIWKDLYLPLKAKRISESLNPFAPRHTLTKDELKQIGRYFRESVVFEANQLVCRQGDKGDNCYIIATGAVEVFIPANNKNEDDSVVAKLEAGDFFGEIALIKRVPRTASVRTTRRTRLVPLNHNALSLLNEKAPAVLDILTEIAQHRLEARSQDPQKSASPLLQFALEGASLLHQSPMDVRDLIAHDQCTVVLGDAGAGKTTVLRRLMLDFAEQAEHTLSTDQEAIVLPVFLKLNGLTPDKSVESLLLDFFHSYELYDFETELDIENFLNGQDEKYQSIHSILFLMDGLNEMPFQDKTLLQLSHFFQKYGQHRFALTCRIQDYTALYGFRTALLERLSSEDVEAFLVNYLKAEKGRKVAKQIFSDPQLEDLAKMPLALYMFTQIADQSEEALPNNRGILFEVFTESLLERMDSKWWQTFGRSKAETPLALRKRVLANLGLMMQEKEALAFSYQRWLEIIKEALIRYREKALPSERVEMKNITSQNVHDEIKHSGLIRHTADPNQIEFTHHTYQEFFAALALRDQNLEIEKYLKDQEGRRHWQGTIILLYGIVPNKSDLYGKILGSENDYARIWLASLALANSGEDLAVALQRFEHELPFQQRFALLFSVGLAARQLGRYADALSYLDMASKEVPGSAEVQYELGSLYRQATQYEKAIERLEGAIHLRSDFVDAYNQLGITYHDQGKYVEALTVFKATTQLEPGNAHHFYNLGTVQKILRNYVAARESFTTALKLKPDYSEARTQLNIVEKALSTGVIRVLDSIPILSKMTLEQSVLLANRIKMKDIGAGHIVFHMGEKGDTFYIIESGEVEVLAPDMGQKIITGVINRLGPGDFFGEIALLQAVPRTATIRAIQPTRLLAINREDFDIVLKKYPSIAHGLAETSSLRLLRDRQIGRRTALDRYYDPGYIAELTQQNEVTVLMGDIHGSTRLINSIGAELMVAFLDEYLIRMSNIIVRSGGAMDKSLGDSVMGVFGSIVHHREEDKASSAKSALLAGVEMRKAYFLLREEWRKEHPDFSNTGMGIGVSTGKIKTGTVGAEATMVGPAVNMSSKLSKLTVKSKTESELYIDDRTFSLTDNSFKTEKVALDYTKKRVGVEIDAYRVIAELNKK